MGVDARMVIRIFCKKIDLYDRERFDSFSTHIRGKILPVKYKGLELVSNPSPVLTILGNIKTGS